MMFRFFDQESIIWIGQDFILIFQKRKHPNRLSAFDGGSYR
jgi:hypothetical protein